MEKPQIEGGWAADISGCPSAFDLTFNGGQVIVEMEGAVVTVPGDEIGESVTNGTTIVANFTNDLSSAIGTYNLAYAAHNRGTVTEKTVVTLNALTVSVETQTYTTWAASWGVAATRTWPTGWKPPTTWCTEPGPIWAIRWSAPTSPAKPTTM